MALLDRETMIRAFGRLGERLGEAGQRAEILLVGGAVMCLVHNARSATKDVDDWFSDPESVRAAARHVAAEMGLSEDWPNDAAKAFIPANAGYETWRELAHLSISAVDAETLLAMKCSASRTDVDVADIRFLADLLELRSAQDVLAVVTRFFPPEQLPVRTKLLLEEMFDAGG